MHIKVQAKLRMYITRYVFVLYIELDCVVCKKSKMTLSNTGSTEFKYPQALGSALHWFEV